VQAFTVEPFARRLNEMILRVSEFDRLVREDRDW
jgi:hypothetical protein